MKAPKNPNWARDRAGRVQLRVAAWKPGDGRLLLSVYAHHAPQTNSRYLRSVLLVREEYSLYELSRDQVYEVADALLHAAAIKYGFGDEWIISEPLKF